MRSLALALAAGWLLGGCCYPIGDEDACLLNQGKACVPVEPAPLCWEEPPPGAAAGSPCPGELRGGVRCRDLGFTTPCGSYLVREADRC